MTSREQFEKAASEYGMIVRRHPSGNYLWSDTDVAWSFWQAAERQAFERAAERCMSILGYPPSEYYAKAIRALIEGASSEKEGS